MTRAYLLAMVLFLLVLGFTCLPTKAETFDAHQPATEVRIEPPAPSQGALRASSPIPGTPIPPNCDQHCMPPELVAALLAYSRPSDINQWQVILRCETVRYDNNQRGSAGELSVGQMLPSTLAAIGLTPSDVRTYDGAMRAMVMVGEQAGRERGGDRFWPWTTRWGCDDAR